MSTMKLTQRMSDTEQSARYEGDEFWSRLPKKPVTSGYDLRLRRIDRSLFVVLIVALILGAALSIVHHEQLGEGVTSCQQN